MIDSMLFGTKTLGVVKQALDVYADRNRVHARNIANAETPGYRAQEVGFEEQMQMALRNGASTSIERTQTEHFGTHGEFPGGTLRARNAESEWTASGFNDVEIDREMSDLARNQMRFSVAAEMVSRAYSGMQKAIHGRRMS